MLCSIFMESLNPSNAGISLSFDQDSFYLKKRKLYHWSVFSEYRFIVIHFLQTLI